MDTFTQDRPIFDDTLAGEFDALRRHTEWFAKLTDDGPVYPVPFRITGANSGTLETGTFRAVRWVNDEDLEAEIELRGICESRGLVGVRRTEMSTLPLNFPPLQPRPSSSDLNQLPVANRPELAWLNEPAVALNLDMALRPYTELQQSFCNVAGYLMTCRPFLDELAEVRRTYEQLDDPPPFPLQPQTGPDVVDGPVPGNIEEYLARLQRLCDRWSVQQIVSWELPLPFGPSLSSVAPAVGFRPSSDVRIDLPAHFDLRRSQEVHNDIAQLQCGEAKVADVPGDYARCSSRDQLGHALKIRLYGDELSRRYAQPERPRGFEGWRTAVLADLLGLETDTIRSYQKRSNRQLKVPRSGPQANDSIDVAAP